MGPLKSTTSQPYVHDQIVRKDPGNGISARSTNNSMYDRMSYDRICYEIVMACAVFIHCVLNATLACNRVTLSFARVKGKHCPLYSLVS